MHTQTHARPNEVDLISEVFELKEDLLFALIYKHKSKNILLVEYYEDTVIGKTESLAIIESVKKQHDPTRVLYGITYATIGSTVNEEGRKCFASDSFSQEKTKAMAVVYNQLAQRLLFSIYIKFNRPKTPLKSFKNITNALIWLNKQGA